MRLREYYRLHCSVLLLLSCGCVPLAAASAAAVGRIFHGGSMCLWSNPRPVVKP